MVVSTSPLTAEGNQTLIILAGHLERCLSFGYDADLSGICAEFDGEYLSIVVPRASKVMDIASRFI